MAVVDSGNASEQWEGLTDNAKWPQQVLTSNLFCWFRFLLDYTIADAG